MKNKTRCIWLLSAFIGAFSFVSVILVNAQATDTSSTETQSLEAEQTTDTQGLRFNFRGVPLDTVLDYLSKSAGFVIVRNTGVAGRLDVVSHQPLTKDEAVNLLNSVLDEKGYAAIRNGRVLTIVAKDEAGKYAIPVKTGRDPEQIPKNDEIVTQIIPVRYTNAVKLIDNIKALLPSTAIISANESSNAIVLTDTQSDIRRMAEIIQALDTSISDIASLKVFMLQYADATETAKVINEVFKTPDNSQTTTMNRRAQFFARAFQGGGDQSSQSSQGQTSEARQAASRVLAVADEHTNAVVVSAPEELMPTIERLVSEMDIASQQLTLVRVFTLRYADATETADLITQLFQPQSTTTQTGFGRRFGPPMGLSQTQQQQSQRQKEESTVVAKADTRTNSVVVTAASETMDQIAMMIQNLDQNPAKEKKVFIYSLKNADPEQSAALLQQLFPQQSGTSSGSSAATSSRTSRSTTTSRSSTSRSSTSGGTTSRSTRQSSP